MNLSFFTPRKEADSRPQVVTYVDDSSAPLLSPRFGMAIEINLRGSGVGLVRTPSGIVVRTRLSDTNTTT